MRVSRSVDEAESPRRLKLPQEEQLVHLVQLPAVIPDVDAAQEGGEVCRLARAQALQEQRPVEHLGLWPACRLVWRCWSARAREAVHAGSLDPRPCGTPCHLVTDV